MSWCVACSPAWWILYHVTASCKGPIIVKFSAYQHKNFIKSFIKNLPKGTNIGISDDFPKEVDEIRRKLYPVLKAAKREKKEAYFKVEKLFINGLQRTGNSSFPSVRMFNEQLVLNMFNSPSCSAVQLNHCLIAAASTPILTQSVNAAQKHR